MIRQRWQELISQNPMLIEITRFRRRYFSLSRGTSVNAVAIVLILICYALLLLVVIQNRESISPIAVILAQTVLLTIFAPMMLYGSVAGERERRSWDLLLAAPITKAQIVAGKFIGAVSALAVAFVAIQVPVLVAAYYFDMAHSRTVFVADCMSFSFVTAVCALTILFSARVKRSLMALGATLGGLVGALIVLPAFLNVGRIDPHMTDASFFLHPIYAINRLNDLDRYYYMLAHSSFISDATGMTGPQVGSEGPPLPPYWGWAQAATYLFLAIVLLAWAANTLNFAENEVKFLPQGHKNA